MQQQAILAAPSLSFSLFGLDVFIERTEHDYPIRYASTSFGPGEREFLILGCWRVVCSW